jgi:hypothetical protein
MIVTDEQIKTLAAAKIDGPLIQKGIRDSLMGIDNSVRYENEVNAYIMYRIGMVRAERMKDRNAMTASRSRGTWSAKAEARN